MNSSPAGGAATINGILYQMLWSLFHVAEIHIKSMDLRPGNEYVSQAKIVLEPNGGGGDIRLVKNSGCCIQQLKTGKHAWSLQSLVTEVLPDLYLAVNSDQRYDRYQLVTEGWRGDWGEVAAFFTSLRERPCPDRLILDSLDHNRPIRFRRMTTGKTPFWTKELYTERSLFEQIAQSLQTNPTIRKAKESPYILHKKTWHLLGKFELVPDQNAHELQSKIDRLLLEMVDKNTHISEKRNALLADLMSRAAQGEAIITAQEFFQSHHLDAIPLSRWNQLLQEASRLLHRRLEILEYNPCEDVRKTLLPEKWPLEVPMLAISGESGQGKSWSLYRLATSLAATNPVILLSAKNSVQETLEAAASAFANIAIRDDELRLERIAARLREINSPRQKQWLYLLIDDVEKVEMAREFALVDWEEWGIALVVSGSLKIMQVFTDTAGRRGELYPVPNFSPQEAERYLGGENSDYYYSIPGDVRQTARRPLVARLYRDITRNTLWEPKTEYELYEHSWENIFRQANDEDLLAEVPLQKLALTLFEGKGYPWSSMQISDAGMMSNQLSFLLRRGALEKTENGFRVSHDRLLNWLVAKSLATAWRDVRMTGDDLIGKVVNLWREPFSELSRQLAYVPMDTIWLLTRSGRQEDNFLAKLFAEIEKADPFDGKELYSRLLPPIGSTIVPAVVRRIEERVLQNPWDAGKALANCLSAFETSITLPICLRFLKTDNYSMLRIACSVLHQRPAAEALEPLWTLLQDINVNEAKYQPEDTSWAMASFLQEDCMEGLKACAVFDPDWVEQAILYREADSKSAMLLGYVLLALPDSEARRRRCQTKLQERLDVPHQRAVADLIYHYPDASATTWLRQQVPQQAGLLGAVAFRALVRMNPSEAIEALDMLPREDLYSTRHWCLRPLMLREPEQLKARFLRMLEASENPLALLEAFQGFEDELSVPHLNVVLDALEKRLTQAPDLSQLDYKDLWHPLERINAAHSLEVLDCLRLRCGSLLEQKLTEWMLLRSSRKDIWADHLGEAGIEMLYRIGGEGFTKVVNAWIASNLHFGMVDGLSRAFKRADDTTIQHCQRIVLQEEPEARLLRCLAMRALAGADQTNLLVKAILTCGFETPRDICDARVGQPPWDDDSLQPALSVLTAVNFDVPPGALLALGIGQRNDFENTLVDILDNSIPASDTEKACLLALSLLQTKEERTVQKIVERRSRANLDQEFTKVALLNNQSNAANALLLETLKREWDTRTALCLLHRGIDKAEIIKGLRERISRLMREMPVALVNELTQIVSHCTDDEVLRMIFEGDIATNLRDMAFAPEGGFWVVGTKVSVIRALAIIDRETAYLAALRVLKNNDARDRIQYPALLLEINKERAIHDLLERMCEEGLQMRASIGRALREQELETLLAEWFSESDPEKRKTACHVAAYQKPTANVLMWVRQCLDDPDADVFEAAVEALGSLRQKVRQTELLQEAQKTKEPLRRWQCLDAALSIGDLGDSHTFWNEELVCVHQDSSYSVQAYMEKTVKERRKKINDELERADRRN